MSFEGKKLSSQKLEQNTQSLLLRYSNYQENESKGWMAALLTFTLGM